MKTPDTVRLAWRLLVARLARRRAARPDRRAGPRGGECRHRRFFHRSSQGCADAAGESAARRRSAAFRRPSAARRVHARGAIARARGGAGDQVQQHGASGRRCGRRGAGRCQGGHCRLSAARRDPAGRPGECGGQSRARRAAAGRSLDRQPARGASRRAARLEARRRRIDADRRRDRAAGPRGDQRPARARAPADDEPGRRRGDAAAAAGQSRVVPAAGRRRRDQCLPRLGAGASRPRTAAGIDPRPAARSAADARARRTVPGPRGAGRGHARRGRHRARRVALSAPSSGRCRDDALPRRAATADPVAVRVAIPGAGRRRQHCRLRAGARRPAAADRSAGRHRQRGPAAAGRVAGIRRRGERSRRAVRLCAAAAVRAVARAAAARAAPRPGTCRAPAAGSPTRWARRRSRC